jgi:hypothetical protein
VKKLLRFWIEEQSETVEDAHLFEVDQFSAEDDLCWAAEQYAEYYHDNRDGWESPWPITFSIASDEKVFLAKVSVDREARPHFHGTKVK